MRSIKTKLIITISLFIILLFSAAAFLLINEKKQELTNDIFVNARSFAELTAVDIVEDYNLYLKEKSFVYFNRNIKDTFQKNVDIDSIQIYRYSGELVYDSVMEGERQYEDEQRKTTDPKLLLQIQSKNNSAATLETNRVIHFKKDLEGIIETVDFNEQKVVPLQQDEKISYFVQPANEEFAVVYGITYKALQERINQTTLRIFLLTLFGVGIGILMAIFYAGSITKPIKNLTEGAQAISTGDFTYRVLVKSKDEIKTLGDAFNKMAADLEVSTKALVYKERVAKELELAGKIQKGLLPKFMPEIAGLDISAGLLPAEEVGGDLYDFIRHDENNLFMYLGDVTGHGVPSSIVVSIANALIYNLAGSKDMKSVLIDANRVIKEKTASNMFLTLVMLHYDVLNTKLNYVNAGHEQMIHYHARDKKVTLAPSGGLALGMLKDISKNLNQDEVILEKDDVLILYSDGIPEAWKNEKEMYGMARFKRAVSEYSDLPTAIAIRNALLADVKEFSSGYKQMDDITLMVLKRK